MISNTVSDVSDYREFLTAVEESVRERFSEDHDISVQKVLKNNSVELDALTIRGRENKVAPSIFLNEHYEAYLSGRSIEEITETIEDIYYSGMNAFETFNVGCLDFDGVKDRLIYKVVSFERNREALAEMPYIRMHDLAVVFCIVIEGEDRYGTIRVDNERLEEWNVSLDEIVKYAKKNTPVLLPYVFKTMAEVMYAMLRAKLGEFEGTEEQREIAERELGEIISRLDAADEDDPVMYVLTTATGVNGSSCLLYEGLLEEIREKIGEDYFIIPSSIHELIMIPVSKANADELNSMVNMVNTENVPPQEVLSDRVYRYPSDRFDL